ncbi:MAG: V-type ATP synthase subunit F, partial [Anaerolineae bacterium]
AVGGRTPSVGGRRRWADAIRPYRAPSYGVRPDTACTKRTPPMGRLIVITTPDIAPGFQLAGVETFAVETPKEAQALLQELMATGEGSLIAIRQELLADAPSRLQQRIAASYRPVVMPIPGGAPTATGEGRQRYIAELIRRAVGFHITFCAEPEEKRAS